MISIWQSFTHTHQEFIPIIIPNKIIGLLYPESSGQSILAHLGNYKKSIGNTLHPGAWDFFRIVLVRVSIPAQTSWPRSSWGGKGLFGLHFHTAVHHQRKSGLELKQVRKQELMQRPWRVLLTGLLPLPCSACFLIEPKTTSPEMIPFTRGPPPLDH